MKTHTHKAPTFRNPTTKQRVVIFPIYGTWNYSVVLFEYRAKYGRDVFMGNKSDCLDYCKFEGFV